MKKKECAKNLTFDTPSFVYRVVAAQPSGTGHNPDLPPALFQLSATRMVSRPAGEMSSSTTKLLGLSGMQSVAA